MLLVFALVPHKIFPMDISNGIGLCHGKIALPLQEGNSRSICTQHMVNILCNALNSSQSCRYVCLGGKIKPT